MTTAQDDEQPRKIIETRIVHFSLPVWLKVELNVIGWQREIRLDWMVN